MPVPAVAEPIWSKPGETRWTTTATRAELRTDRVSGAQFLHAVWDASSGPKVLELISTVSTQNRAADLSQPGQTPHLAADQRALYT